VPAGLVALMRHELRWDVFFVLEQEDLRRASDLEHFRLARQMRRTLVSLDRDYLDDRRFPPAETGGVVVVSAPDEWQLARVLRRVDRCCGQRRRRAARRWRSPPAPAAPCPRCPSKAARSTCIRTGAWTTRRRAAGERGDDTGDHDPARGNPRLPDRLLQTGTLVVENGLITEVREGRLPSHAHGGVRDLDGRLVVPGSSTSTCTAWRRTTCSTPGPVAAVAARLPKHGVTASVRPPWLHARRPRRGVRADPHAARQPPQGAARVLPAHLESNFINPDYKGHSLDCLRRRQAPPRCECGSTRPTRRREPRGGDRGGRRQRGFTGADIRATIAAWVHEVGIVTLHRELEGALDLIRDLVACGHRVSLATPAPPTRRPSRASRRRPARDAPLQPHVAADPSGARARRGRPGARRDRRRDHL